MRYTYNKLVRDKIPENIDKKEGRKSKYRILNDKEYLEELNKTVIEEQVFYFNFVEDNSAEELGDLFEVLKTIMDIKGYSVQKIEEVMKNKRAEKGAFKNKIFLEYVDEEKKNRAEERELNKDFRNK